MSQLQSEHEDNALISYDIIKNATPQISKAKLFPSKVQMEVASG